VMFSFAQQLVMDAITTPFRAFKESQSKTGLLFITGLSGFAPWHAPIPKKYRRDHVIAWVCRSCPARAELRRDVRKATQCRLGAGAITWVSYYPVTSVPRSLPTCPSHAFPRPPCAYPLRSAQIACPGECSIWPAVNSPLRASSLSSRTPTPSAGPRTLYAV